MFNYRRISDEIITSGMPTVEQLRALASEGFTTVINLATDHPAHSLENEAEWVRSLGMRYIHIPVEWSAPQESDFARFEQALQNLPPGKTLIHCVANYRATAFYSLYAQKHIGWSPAQAGALVASVWEPGEYPAWAAFIARIGAQIKPG